MARDSKNRRLFLEVDGVLKELDMSRLPDDIVNVLLKEFDTAKIVGYSRQRFTETAFFLKDQTLDYVLAMHENGKSEMAMAKTYARSFHISSMEELMLFNSLCLVNAMAMDASYTSRDVNCKTIIGHLNQWTSDGCSYAKLNREFREWRFNPFRHADLNIGFIRFLKYAFALFRSNMEPALEMAVA